MLENFIHNFNYNCEMEKNYALNECDALSAI